MAKAFKEAFQRYVSQLESRQFSLVQRLQQRKAPSYMISAAQKFTSMLNELLASRLNVPELPGVPKPPKLNETITIPTIDFQKLKERAPLHKRILIDNIEKLHEKIINSIEEPKFTRLEEALDEKLGELYEEAQHITKVLKSIDEDLEKEYIKLKGEWEALMYEYVNNKLAQYPDIHKKIEDELLEMRYNKEDMTRDVPSI